MHIGAINMNDVNNLNFFNFVDTLQPQKLMLMWNSYGFSPKIKAKDLLEIVYVTSTIYMMHNNVPTVVSLLVCNQFSQVHCYIIFRI